MAKTRYPLEQQPLRNPGQSVDNRIQDVLVNRFIIPFGVAVFLVGLAAYAWLWRVFPPSVASTWIVTVFALAAVAYAVRQFSVAKDEGRRLVQGRDGEVWVAQFLEANRDDSWRLINDVPGSGFNVDHVLITPQGVFVIETKTYSKPEHGQAKVTVDGERLLFNGFERGASPITQAKAERDYIRNVLFETTGTRFLVKAVVVVPGWYVEGVGHTANSDVWVLNPKMLPAFVRKERESITLQDIALVASRLADQARRPEWSA